MRTADGTVDACDSIAQQCSGTWSSEPVRGLQGLSMLIGQSSMPALLADFSTAANYSVKYSDSDCVIG